MPPRIPNDDKQRRARLCFLIALLTIDKEGVAGFPVDQNPIQVLESRVLPAWKSASVLEAPRRNFVKYLEMTAQRDRTRSRLLNEWATEFKLVGPDGQPLSFIVDEARRLCEAWSTEASRTNRQFSTIPPMPFAEPNKDFISLDRPNEAAPTLLVVPMRDAARLPGETRAQFEKRARRALNKYLKDLRLLDDLAAPQPIESSRKRQPKVPSVKLEHFIWVALFLCCDWPLRRISAAYYNLSAPAISRAVAEKAELIGIRRKQKSVNKAL